MSKHEDLIARLREMEKWYRTNAIRGTEAGEKKP